MKAVIFCRVSSRDQEETGYSLPSQEKFLLDYAQRKEFEIVKVVSTAESASRYKRRKVFDEMLSYVQTENIHVIICEKVDRFTRSHKDSVTIGKWIMANQQNEVHFVKNYFILNQSTKASERFTWNIHVSKAEYDLDNLSEEVKKGQVEKLESGWKPSRPPLGYKSVYDDGKVIQVFDDKTSGMVKRMLNLYSTGNYSVKILSDLMFSEGLRSKKGQRVSSSRVHGYLTNPYYTGLIPWKGNTYSGKHEPLIDMPTFNRNKELLKGNNTPKKSIHDFAFKALLRCKECTGIITWETHKGITYGHCNHYRSCKQTKWLKENDAIIQLSPALVSLQVKNERLRSWIYHALLSRQVHDMQYRKDARESLLVSFEKAKKKISNLVDMRTSNEIDPDMYSQKKQKYLEEKQQIEASLLKYENNEVKSDDLVSKIYAVSQNALQEFASRMPDRKRSLLRLIFSSITLDQGKLDFEYTKRFQALKRIVELTNSSKVAKIVKNTEPIFEPSKYPITTFQNPLFSPSYSALRR